MVAICNRRMAHSGGALDFWIRNVARANVSNAMVVALDDETELFCSINGMTVIRMAPVVGYPLPLLPLFFLAR